MKKSLSLLIVPFLFGCLKFSDKKDYPMLIEVNKQKQKMFISLNNKVVISFLVSTGKGLNGTPNFKTKIKKIEKKHSSNLYPGGDFRGLGNMPYYMQIEGAYAIHGTVSKNYLKLGKTASHGCVRLHPADAEKLWNIVDSIGPNKTYVTIH